MNLHKFTVSLTEIDALTTMSVWSGHERMRESLDGHNVFDNADDAHDRLAELIESAKADGLCEPGHECGRCIDWPPQVYEVVITATAVSRETAKGE